MTPQEVFDIGIGQVIKQGCLSADENQCLYRGPNGTRCAIGALVSDEWAEKNEGHGVRTCKLPDELEDHEKLLSDMQYAHDEAPIVMGGDPMSAFRLAARSVAINHGLEWRFS